MVLFDRSLRNEKKLIETFTVYDPSNDRVASKLNDQLEIV